MFLSLSCLKCIEFLGCVDYFSSNLESFEPWFLNIFFLLLSLSPLLLGLQKIQGVSVHFCSLFFLSLLQNR